MTLTVTKAGRQRAILDLIRTRSIGSQRELAEALAERGHVATQATVSRDIQELGLVRGPNGYIATPPNGDSQVPVEVTNLITGVTKVQFIMVIRTRIGCANVVGAAIDAAGVPGVAGTVAGDDTLIAVLEEDAAAQRLSLLLRLDD